MTESWCYEQVEKSSLTGVFRGIAQSYQPREFKAATPTNEHFHTILGSGVILDAIIGRGVARPFETEVRWLSTPDDDFFAIEICKPNVNTSEAVVCICHGLESSTRAPLVTNMASALHERGFSAVLVGFRGCSGEDNASARAYHLGFTDDLKIAVAHVRELFPHKKIYVSGFSLGGNVALKFLGELGESALHENVYGGVAVCVPFDPVASQDKLAKGFNKAVYASNLLRTLKKKAAIKAARFPDMFDMEAIDACKTIGEFDSAFIVPLYGFKDKVDYYMSTGAKWWINKIRVPAVTVNAIDDPFIDAPSLPQQDFVQPDVPVKLCYTDHGGHCGFISADGEEKSHGWLAEETARAIEHIHKGIMCDLDASLGRLHG